MTFVTEEVRAQDVSTLTNHIFKDGLCVWSKVLIEPEGETHNKT